jgi:hypothetical protein
VSHTIGRVARRDGGNPRFFYQTLNQTHGLMTLRSDRHQKNDVDSRSYNQGYKLWNCFCNQ